MVIKPLASQNQTKLLLLQLANWVGWKCTSSRRLEASGKTLNELRSEVETF